MPATKAHKGSRSRWARSLSRVPVALSESLSTSAGLYEIDKLQTREGVLPGHCLPLPCLLAPTQVPAAVPAH
ncbi:hypothetical protein WJX82_002898 [Trebouxia sp. C0006]